MGEEMRPEWIYKRLLAQGMSPHDARRIMDLASKMPQVHKEPDPPIEGTTSSGPLFYSPAIKWNIPFSSIDWGALSSKDSMLDWMIWDEEDEEEPASVGDDPVETMIADINDELAIRFMVYDAFRDREK